MKKEIKISEENALNAYKNASPDGKELLEHLLGKDLFKPKDIMERIKTFDDALQELNTKAISGDETAAILLADYESNADNIKNPQILAYMILAIIAYALNEGWEPKFTTDEYRYYPWFCLYTQKEIDEMDEEDKGRVLGRSHYVANAYAGVAYSYTNGASAISYSYYGGRLCFKTRDLAEYAGKQFLDIWAEFMMFTTNGK